MPDVLPKPIFDLTVDRVEEDYAVVEAWWSGQETPCFLDVPLSAIPHRTPIHEGDKILFVPKSLWDRTA